MFIYDSFSIIWINKNNNHVIIVYEETETHKHQKAQVEHNNVHYKGGWEEV